MRHSAATLKKSRPDRCLGRSRGGLNTKIHALTDECGLAVRFVITPSNTHDIRAAAELLFAVQPRQMILRDKAYDANWLRDYVSERGSRPNIPPKSWRKSPICFSPWLYMKRNLVERVFNKLKYFRTISTGYDKFGSTFYAMVQLARIRVRLSRYESTA